MSLPEFDVKLAACPPGLQDIIEEFRLAEPRERLEYLVEYAMEMPDLPERLASKMDEMEQVHECQSPVFLHTELENDYVKFYLGIPARRRPYAATPVRCWKDWMR